MGIAFLRVNLDKSLCFAHAVDRARYVHGNRHPGAASIGFHTDMGEYAIMSTSDLGSRIKEALDKRGWNAHELHGKLRDLLGEDQRGTSYGAIRDYLAGRIENPRPAVLEGMADLLHVPRAWLIEGVGPMTVEAHSAREVAFEVAAILGAGGGDTDARQEILEAIAEGVGGDIKPNHPSLFNLEQVFWRRWSAQEEYLPEERRLDSWELAVSIGRAAVAPLRALGIEPAELEQHELDFFLPSMYGPLIQAAKMFGEESVEEVEDDQE